MVVGQEAFMTDGAPDSPMCEKMNGTLGIYIKVQEPTHTRKNPYQIRQANH
jgi:hypothetical protein